MANNKFGKEDKLVMIESIIKAKTDEELHKVLESYKLQVEFILENE